MVDIKGTMNKAVNFMAQSLGRVVGSVGGFSGYLCFFVVYKYGPSQEQRPGSFYL